MGSVDTQDSSRDTLPGGADMAASVRPARRSRDAAPALGDVVGRYVILERLGAGGMGIVYTAYDPELERKVALKLLRPRPGRGQAEGRQRLVREAQAMARLSHPNVVTVHDVGEHEGNVFVAMELIDGMTLRRWLDQGERDWRSVLAVLIEAGQGLAAAHAAQLVHRDFKPENVMVAHDGRVRVLDFGLVRPIDGDDPDSASGSDSGGTPALVAADVAGLRGTSTIARGGSLGAAGPQTQVGAVMGTPAYMSPEQFEGRTADARSDQFSFCVVAYEALYGQRPFEGDAIVELAAEVLAGRVAEPPRRTTVPGWLRRALLIGLAPAPAQRHASMDALLTALRSDPSRRRRRWLAVGTVALLGAGLYGGVQWSTTRAEQACRERGHAIDEDWNDAARASVRDALLGTRASFADETWALVEPALDGYAAQWRAASERACLAHTVQERWDAPRHAAATGCLDERRASFSSLRGVLEQADLEVLIRASAAVGELPAIEACVDEARLDRRPVRLQQTREAVVALRAAGIEAQVLHSTGRRAQARRTIDDAVTRARALEDPELLAHLESIQLHVVAGAGEYEDAVALGRRAYFAFGRLGDDEEQMHLAGHLARLEAEHQGHVDVAEDWQAHARMLWERTAGPDASQEPAWLEHTRAVVLAERGDYDEALALAQGAVEQAQRRRGEGDPALDTYMSTVTRIEDSRGNYALALQQTRRALEHTRRVRGEHHPDVARGLTNMAILSSKTGDLEAAQTLAREAVALAEESLGPDHPWTAAALQAQASVASARGKTDEAVPLLERVVAIYDARLSEDAGERMRARTALGGLLVRQGEHARAVEVLEAACQMVRASRGARHPELVNALLNLGAAQRGLGNDEAGAQAYQEAIEVAEATLGADHPMLSYPLHNLGKIELERGNLPRARELLTRALEIRETKLGADNPMTASSLEGLAEVALAQGDRVSARTRAERALAILEAKHAFPERVAGIQWVLARAWVQDDRDRALALARDAQQGYAEHGEPEAHDRVQAWLDEQGADRADGATRRP